MTKMSPTQQKAFDHLIKTLPLGNVFVVWLHSGMGRTSLLQEFHRLRGGDMVTMKDYIDQE